MPSKLTPKAMPSKLTLKALYSNLARKAAYAGAVLGAAALAESALGKGTNNPEGHYARRLLLGNPASAAIEAREGKKRQAYREASAYSLKNMGRAGALGTLSGAVLGGVVGPKVLSANMPLAPRVAIGVAAGTLLGLKAGTIAGNIKSRVDGKASEIHGRYSKHKVASMHNIDLSAMKDELLKEAVSKEWVRHLMVGAGLGGQETLRLG